ncbi:MAG: metallophosphoesterase [Termitinemataceae bacterium]|nr:MAG: metallophosphoesterase [Termitinemataceae bacterium]
METMLIEMKIIRRFFMSFFPITTLLASCATHESLVVKTYKIESQKIKEGTQINIVLLTDLHNDIYGESQEPLVQKIKDAKPDIILLGGDIVDDKVPIKGTEILCSKIKNIAPIYYVSGNHEYMSNNIETIYSTLQSYGIIILSDTFVELELAQNKIVLCGIEDIYRKTYYDKSYNINSTKQIIKDAAGFNEFKILFIHRPERAVLYKNYGYDLMLCGHAHGGQLRIKGILDNGLYAPGQGFFPAYTGGHYTFDKSRRHTNLIVSAGLTTKRPGFMRMGNPPEIVVIQISR